MPVAVEVLADVVITSRSTRSARLRGSTLHLSTRSAFCEVLPYLLLQSKCSELYDALWSCPDLADRFDCLIQLGALVSNSMGDT